jgi:hypothetical protein
VSASIDFLPVWKKDATPFERLTELAEIARKHPERFRKFVIAYEETKADDMTRLRTHSYGVVNVNETVGLLEFAKRDIMESALR